MAEKGTKTRKADVSHNRQCAAGSGKTMHHDSTRAVYCRLTPGHLVRPTSRPVRLAVLDWDGTLQPNWTLLDWIDYLVRAEVLQPNASMNISRVRARCQVLRAPKPTARRPAMTAYTRSGRRCRARPTRLAMA